ncbi:hypothetical protein [Aquabacterium sp. J223]|uniref:hypothetical protein n=1 Tax=Aquabacterium sp. J223 TaxID=2898431 RepID=UPI0021ADD334|nr:hypothetical protein [Aquabacterium sp. J223]UUX96435.1 hypothetical protein LRS07_03730 [Aquabacterium sp. J223]
MNVNPNRAPAAAIAIARGWRAALAAGALALLASCGGGSLEQAFVPAGFVVFGDEQSLVLGTTDPATGATYPTGRKYGYNVGDNCSASELWTQYLLRVRGYSFAECAPANTAVTAGGMKARPRARLADVAAQVDAYLATGPTDRMLATVMAGTWDLIDLYVEVRDGRLSLAQANEQAKVRGQQLGQQIVRLSNAGVRVLVVTTFNPVYSPWGQAQRNANPGVDVAGVLRALTESFNIQAAITFQGAGLDGRKVGWYDAASEVQQVVENGTARANVGIGDWTTPLCANSTATLNPANPDPTDPDLPACVTPRAGITNVNLYLWSGAVTLGPQMHARIGLRVQNLLAVLPL